MAPWRGRRGEGLGRGMPRPSCFIHAVICRVSKSSMDAISTPRVVLPIATGVTGGTGVSVTPLMNISLT